MLGIIGAMASEVDALATEMKDAASVQMGVAEFYVGYLRGVHVVLARCGVGKVHAAMCAQAMILRFTVTAIINIGVAGALTRDLNIGDVVVGTGTVQHDIDTTAVGDPLGLISNINRVSVPTDERLTALLCKSAAAAGRQAVRSNIATGDQFIVGTARKQHISDTFHAAACDMECGAIAQVCYEMDMPYAAYRAISDTMGGNGLEYRINLAGAAKSSADLLGAFLAFYREEHVR